jgi:hypothetical protein
MASRVQLRGGVEPEPDPAEEWEFLTFDTDEVCSVCGEPMHAGQAVGRLGGSSVHAKCYDRLQPAA